MADYQSIYTGPQIDTAIGAVSGKQDTLVSGTNIKTINNESVLGSGNITIGGGAGLSIRTIDTSDPLEWNGEEPTQAVLEDIIENLYDCIEVDLGGVFVRMYLNGYGEYSDSGNTTLIRKYFIFDEDENSNTVILISKTNDNDASFESTDYPCTPTYEVRGTISDTTGSDRMYFSSSNDLENILEKKPLLLKITDTNDGGSVLYQYSTEVANAVVYSTTMMDLSNKTDSVTITIIINENDTTSTGCEIVSNAQANQ